MRVRLMGVRVSNFQGAADPIPRSQPYAFISFFLRGSTADNNMDSINDASAAAPCAKEVTQFDQSHIEENKVSNIKNFLGHNSTTNKERNNSTS